jgi:hypothetical protein
MGVCAQILATKPGQSKTGPTIESLDIDKAWHALHFLLSATGEPVPGPEGFLQNGERIQDTGEAEVYLHTLSEVAALDQLLDHVTPRVLLERYDPARMKALRIYPESDWDQRDFDHLLWHYNGLRSFVKRHAEAGHELLVLIS